MTGANGADGKPVVARMYHLNALFRCYIKVYIGFDPEVGFGVNPLVKENCHSSLVFGLHKCACCSATTLHYYYRRTSLSVSVMVTVEEQLR